jgi:hypothetical protein
VYDNDDVNVSGYKPNIWKMNTQHARLVNLRKLENGFEYVS